MNRPENVSGYDKDLGQLFMVGMPGTRVDSGTEGLIRAGAVGGIILFDRNIEDPVQLAELCTELQGIATESRGRPLFLALDQEGGPVARLKAPFTQTPGNEAIGRDSHPEEKAVRFAKATAKEMTMVGLNMNLAPVLDVRAGESQSHMAGRMFSDQSEVVARLGRAVIGAFQGTGVMATAKHFPGLGAELLDPHFDLPVVDTPAEEIETVNLLPFKAAIEEGVCAVMSSHAVYTAIDPDHPATLSFRILTSLLRERLGFRGLVVTDDLEMGAIERIWGTPKGALFAFDAGADILLIAKNQQSAVEAVELLEREIDLGNIAASRVSESLNRIGDAKSGLMNFPKRVKEEELRNYFSL